jgi:hypothetical protein
MAISGIGREYDVPFKAASTLCTNTTQYLAVGMQGQTTTVDWTVYLTDNAATLSDTMTSRGAIGINQTYMSANSEACTVRMFGLSKVKCAASIAAGDWIRAYEGVSTTTFAGYVVAVALAGSCTVATTSITAGITVLGKALEDGSTNTVITAMINPQLYDLNLVNG